MTLISMLVLVLLINSQIHLVNQFFILSFYHFLFLINNFIIVIQLTETRLEIIDRATRNLAIRLNYISCPESLFLLRHLLFSYHFLFSLVFVFQLGTTQSSFQFVFRCHLFLKLLERLSVMIRLSAFEILLRKIFVGYNLLFWLLLFIKLPFIFIL